MNSESFYLSPNIQIWFGDNINPDGTYPDPEKRQKVLAFHFYTMNEPYVICERKDGQIKELKDPLPYHVVLSPNETEKLLRFLFDKIKNGEIYFESQGDE